MDCPSGAVSREHRATHGDASCRIRADPQTADPSGRRNLPSDTGWHCGCIAAKSFLQNGPTIAIVAYRCVRCERALEIGARSYTAAIPNGTSMNSISRSRTSITPAPRPRARKTNGICERFHKTVLNEFYRGGDPILFSAHGHAVARAPKVSAARKRVPSHEAWAVGSVPTTTSMPPCSRRVKTHRTLTPRRRIT